MISFFPSILTSLCHVSLQWSKLENLNCKVSVLCFFLFLHSSILSFSYFPSTIWRLRKFPVYSHTRQRLFFCRPSKCLLRLEIECSSHPWKYLLIILVSAQYFFLYKIVFNVTFFLIQNQTTNRSCRQLNSNHGEPSTVFWGWAEVWVYQPTDLCNSRHQESWVGYVYNTTCNTVCNTISGSFNGQSSTTPVMTKSVTNHLLYSIL